MNFKTRDLSNSFQVGKSGGSTGQSYDIKRSRRGLVQEQSEPLVIWWVKLLRQEYSADRISASRQKSYRRSRWGHPAGKLISPISPFSAMHRDGRLLTPSADASSFPGAITFVFLVITGLIASLNVVALAEPAVTSVGHSAVSANEIPSAKRFSMMKDFVGQHNQYLDLSKLNEFKWTDETRVAARGLNQKRHMDTVFADTDGGFVAQPRVVQQERRRQKKNDAKLTAAEESSNRQTQTGSASGSRPIPGSETGSHSSGHYSGQSSGQ
ncbi:MAG: hypothetical protein C0469_05810 [Cyanobacteria bacterium DS2.3.42]|nr:hypothetical protein [Cyanobacteria bacterium DS2.3.42]